MSSIRDAFWYLALIASFGLLALYWRAFVDIENITVKVSPWLPKLAFAVIILFTVNIFLRTTRPIVQKAYYKHFKKEDWKLFSKLYSYVVWGTALIIVVVGIFGGISSLGISLGLIGAGLAFALQQVILSLAGWFLIVIKHPYKIGDRIQIKKEDLVGDVEDITVFFTVLKEVSMNESATGKNIIIPNSIVFRESIVNYGYDVPQIWTSVPFSITYESDLALAQKIIFEAAKSVAGEDMKNAAKLIRKTTPESVQVDMAKEEPIIRVEFADSSITVTARIMCLPRRMREYKSEIYKKVFDAFNEPQNKDKVEIAYPHLELVLHDEVLSERFKKFLVKD